MIFCQHLESHNIFVLNFISTTAVTRGLNMPEDPGIAAIATSHPYLDFVFCLSSLICFGIRLLIFMSENNVRKLFRQI